MTPPARAARRLPPPRRRQRLIAAASLAALVAPEVGHAQVQPVSAMTASAQATGGPVVLTPIQGPLTLDGRYLGDLSGAVNREGQGIVDGPRFLELIKPVASPELYEALESRVKGRRETPITDLAADGFSLAFDTFSLSFVVELAAGARGRQELRVGRTEIPNPADYDRPARVSLGANIALAQSYSHDAKRFRPMSGAAEILGNIGGFTGLTVTGGFTYDGAADSDRWQRREIRVIKDLFDSAIRLSAGELTAPVDGLQGSARILGVSAARAYGVIRPFQNIRPSGRRQFILDQPSYVEAEVNGVVVERLQLQPGPYSLSDFPFGRGANTVRLTIEDTTGRRELAVFELFGGAGLLDRGVIDFGATAGVVEEGGDLNFGSTIAASGFVQAGVLDALTLGANAQWVEGRAAQAGALVVHGSRLGLVQANAAASYNERSGEYGYAGALDYLKEFSVRERDDLRLSVSLQGFSRRFQDAFAFEPDNAEVWRAAAQTSWRFARWSTDLGLSYAKGRGRNPDQSNVDLSVGRSFGRLTFNALFGWRDLNPGRSESRVGLGVNVRFGQRSSFDARYGSSERLREVIYNRSSTGDLGDLSGQLRLAEDRRQQAISGDLRYINNRFEGQLAYNRLTSNEAEGSSSQDTFMRLATFVGFADGVFGVGRPARESFVIAKRHPSLRGSRVSLRQSGGREVARSGWFGPAVAGIDRAFASNRFEIAVDPLPAGYDLGTGLVNAFPAYGNGYRVMVGSDASRTVVGTLIGPEGPIGLVSGTIEPVGGTNKAMQPKPFFTNRGGRFVGDGLAPGRYRLIVDGAPVGEFSIAKDQEGMIDVGQIRAPKP